MPFDVWARREVSVLALAAMGCMVNTGCAAPSPKPDSAGGGSALAARGGSDDGPPAMSAGRTGGGDATGAGASLATGGGGGVAGAVAANGGSRASGGSTASGEAGAATGSSDAVIAGRLFAADSPWNAPIAAKPELEADSKARIVDFESSSTYGEHLDVNIARYSIPLFYADATTPKQVVECDIGGMGWSGGSDGKNRTAMVPWPMGATPDPESDHHLLVIDRSTHTEFGMFDVQQSGGKWHCGLGATSDLTGSGVRPVASGNPTWYTSHGPRACGFPLAAGLIRREEIEAGRIEHALVIAYPHVQAGMYLPPASTAQALVPNEAIKTRGIPCGGRLQYDPSIDLDKLELSRSGLAIMRALQTYGAYVGDYSGAISLYAEGSASAQQFFAQGQLDMYELKGKIDLADFRVLKLGKLYDNGNGG